jgi:hypothetical protein
MPLMPTHTYIFHSLTLLTPPPPTQSLTHSKGSRLPEMNRKPTLSYLTLAYPPPSLRNCVPASRLALTNEVAVVMFCPFLFLFLFLFPSPSHSPCSFSPIPTQCIAYILQLAPLMIMRSGWMSAICLCICPSRASHLAHKCVTMYAQAVCALVNFIDESGVVEWNGGGGNERCIRSTEYCR